MIDHFSVNLVKIKKYDGTFWLAGLWETANLILRWQGCKLVQSFWEGYLAIAKNTLCAFSICASNSTSRYLQLHKQENTYKIILCSIDCNCKMLETNRRLKHQRVVHPMGCSYKKERGPFFEWIWSDFQCGRRKTVQSMGFQVRNEGERYMYLFISG